MLVLCWVLRPHARSFSGRLGRLDPRSKPRQGRPPAPPPTYLCTRTRGTRTHTEFDLSPGSYSVTLRHRIGVSYSPRPLGLSGCSGVELGWFGVENVSLGILWGLNGGLWALQERGVEHDIREALGEEFDLVVDGVVWDEDAVEEVLGEIPEALGVAVEEFVDEGFLPEGGGEVAPEGEDADMGLEVGGVRADIRDRGLVEVLFRVVEVEVPFVEEEGFTPFGDDACGFSSPGDDHGAGSPLLWGVVIRGIPGHRTSP